MQIRAFGDHQGEDNDESTRQLLQQSLSSGSFRLVRLPGGDSATRPQDSTRNVEDRDLHIWDNDEDEDEEEEEEEEEIQLSYWRPPHAQTPKWFPPVTTPQEAGKRLLVSGEFGRIGFETRSRKGGASLAKAILSRQTKLRQTPMQDVTNVSGVYVLGVQHSSQRMQAIVPNSNGTAVASLTDNIYCGQYSASSYTSWLLCFWCLIRVIQTLPSITHAAGVWCAFVSADVRAESSVDFRLHIFDTTAPPTNPKQVPQPTEWHHERWAPDEPTTMKVIKVIQGSSGGWTITDAHLSPDNERLDSPVVRLLCLSANTESFIPPL
jgi:WD repeat-containing protein 23